MKHLKSYENTTEDEPQIGDHVLCKEDDTQDSDTNELFTQVNDFINSNIGILSQTTYDDEYKYVIKYENIPAKIQFYFYHKEKGCRVMKRSEILYHSKNKEDIIPYLNANKYNLL